MSLKGINKREMYILNLKKENVKIMQLLLTIINKLNGAKIITC